MAQESLDSANAHVSNTPAWNRGLDIPSTLCALPWIALCGTIEGVWTRCCHDRSGQYFERYWLANAGAPQLAAEALGCTALSPFAGARPSMVCGPAQAFNSPQMRRTRLEMLAGSKPPVCSHCYETERLGLESQRQQMNAFPAANVLERVRSTRGDGRIDYLPVHYDFRLGNQCSLRCGMCGPPTSSSWMSICPNGSPGTIDPYSHDHTFWRGISDVIPDIGSIYFAGGEPFLQPSYFRMLELLVASGRSSAVTLHHHSNLSTIPLGLMDRFSDFRKVLIRASCDAFGEDYEKIRRGASWETFTSNLRIVAQHVEVLIDVAVQRDTLPSLLDLIAYAASEHLQIRIDNYVRWPEHLCVRSLPTRQKDYYADLLRQAAAEMSHHHHVVSSSAAAGDGMGLLPGELARARYGIAEQLNRLVAFMVS